MSDERALEAAIFWDAHGQYGVDSLQFDAFVHGVAYGAGWLAAIVGMSQAIRDRPVESAWHCALCHKQHLGHCP